jgi:hypothetical protein
MTMRTRMPALVAASAVLATTFVGASPARADGPVTITATGPASVSATVGRASATSWATFAITDTSATASSLFVCYIPPGGEGPECDTVALTASAYGDGNPQVTGGSGVYQYRSRIAYNDISKDECWSSFFAKQPYRITVSVRNGADVELASATHPYKVACTGIAGASSGPSRLVVYAGRSSKKAVVKYFLLDTTHRATSIRLCNYDEINDRYYGCQRERMPSKWRTSYGWAFNYTRSWGPMGSSACALVKRRWPDVGTRVEFYDENLRKLTSLYRGFHLECG